MLVYCGQTVGWIMMKLDVHVGVGAGHIVLDGNPAPPLLKGHSPQFSAHVCCDQTAGWIKTPLGTVVGLGPSNIVLDVDPAPPARGTVPPPPQKKIGPCLLWPYDWMDQDATWYEGRPRPIPHCVTWRPSSPAKGAQQPPSFGPCLLSRSPISATSELLLQWP